MYLAMVFACALVVTGISIFPLFASYVLSKRRKKAVVLLHVDDHVAENEFEAKWIKRVKLGHTVAQVSACVFAAMVLWSMFF